jgi:hypothetical protein
LVGPFGAGAEQARHTLAGNCLFTTAGFSVARTRLLKLIRDVYSCNRLM